MFPDQLRRNLNEGMRAVRERIPHDSLQDFWQRYYWVVAGVSVAGGVVAMGRPFVRRHGVGPPLPHSDSIILEYVGWFVANGNTLYTDIWEIKPPVAFLPTYLFAQATGTNMYAHHLLAIATTAIGLVLTATFTARVIGALTDSPVAGLAAGVAFFALPDLFYLPWLGYNAKMMVFVFGMAGLDRAVHERHFASGILAGLAVGFWQLALVFPVVTTIYAARTRSLAELKRHVGGGLVALGVIIGSLLLYADIGGFVAEVILGPLVLETEGGPFDPRTFVVFFHPTWWSLITLVGAGGLALAVRDAERYPAWPLAVGGVLVTGIIVFIDFDGLWDMVYPIVFIALGAGLLVSYLPRRWGVATVLVFALLVAPTFAPSEFIRHDPVELEPSDGLPPALDAEREYVYWTPEPVSSCRFFGARTQRSILQYYPDADTLADAPCGDVGLYWNVTRDQLG